MNNTKDLKKYLANKKVRTENNISVFEVDNDQIQAVCNELYHEYQLPLKIVTALDNQQKDHSFAIYYIFEVPNEHSFVAPVITVKEEKFPSLVNQIHELLWYEREIYTFFGLVPEGYPGLQPIILVDWPKGNYPLRKDFKWDSKIPLTKGSYKTEVVKGEGLYVLPVGPVHAGIIEPGYFRFTLVGEEVISLEPRLGYVHKGSEKLFETLPLDQKIALSERISGDSSFSHSLAFCQAVEQLAGIHVPKRALYLRVLFNELERLANHFNDIGFIMMDTAYIFGGSHGARLREIVMRINDQLTGSRFLRGVNVIGGVTRDISLEEEVNLLQELRILEQDYKEVMAVALDSTSMINRLKGAGVLDKQVAVDHGVVGIVARAVGIMEDARKDSPYAAYKEIDFKLPKYESGDVYARFMIRVEEVYQSIRIIEQALKKLAPGVIQSNQSVKLAKNSLALGITEGWRGEIVYSVFTDQNGEITRVCVRDPSFLNWTAVPYAVNNNVVPDFPLINKSFNLSYSGNDR